MDNYEISLDIDFRKQEGIFYSPNVLTEYIVNQVFKEYFYKKENIFEALQKVKILDPSCGTGAFLLQSFDYLSNFYQNHFPNIQNPKKWIVENNLYGVDIDENAVKICQNRLFEKSNFLCLNIKIGNSLIDDKTVDAKAFDWQKEFPKTVGGFDLIVGNPPWGAEISKEKENFIKKSLELSQKIDSSGYFILRIGKLLKKDACFSFIIPKSILFYNSWETSRQFILSKELLFLCDVGLAFSEVNLESVIFCIKNKPAENSDVRISRFEPLKKANVKKELVKLNSISQVLMQKNETLILTDINAVSQKIIEKIQNINSFLKDFDRKIFRGLYIPDAQKEKLLGHGETLFVNKVPDVDAFQLQKISKIDLTLYKSEIENKIKLLSVDRIVIKVMRGKKLKAAFVPKNIISTEKLVNLTTTAFHLKYVLAVLNAKLTSFYLQKTLFSDTTETSRVMDDCYLGKIPIFCISLEKQKEVADKVDIIIDNYQKINHLSSKFLKISQAEFKFDKISERLEKWYELDWASFQDELNRLKKPILTKKKLEWLEIFEEQQSQILPLSKQIQNIENELNQMFYKLYNLSAEEIKMVENG